MSELPETSASKGGLPEKRLAQAYGSQTTSMSLTPGQVSHPFIIGSAVSQGRTQSAATSAISTDARFQQYKLNPQAALPGMANLGTMKAARSGIIQAEVMKHESVLTGKIAPEEQKKYKNLRSIYVANLAAQVKITQLQEYLLRVFTRAGGLIEKTGNAVE